MTGKEPESPMHDETGEKAEGQSLSLPRRMLGVFFIPGVVFDDVASTPLTPWNWIAPCFLLSFVSVSVMGVLLQDPTISSELVRLFSIPGAPSPLVESLPPAAFLFGLVGAMVFVNLAAMSFLFAFTLFFWLVGRSAMSASVPLLKVAEVVGLSWMIIIAELVCTAALMLTTRSLLVTPSAALILSSFDATNKIHLILAKLNPFTFWLIGILSLGLARVFHRDFPKVLVLLGSLWVLWSVVSLLGDYSVQ